MDHDRRAAAMNPQITVSLPLSRPARSNSSSRAASALVSPCVGMRSLTFRSVRLSASFHLRAQLARACLASSPRDRSAVQNPNRLAPR